MKHKLKIILLALIGIPLVLVLTFLPLYVERPEVQTKVLNRIGGLVGQELTGAHVRWRWLPAPHLSLRKVQLSTDQGVLNLEKTDLYPAWLDLLGRRTLRIKEVALIRPEIFIKTLPEAGKQPGKLPLPPNTLVTMTNGTLAIDQELLPDFFKRQPLEISGINASLGLVDSLVNISLDCATNFCKKLNAKGHLNLDDLSYSFDLNTETLQLHTTITSLIKGKLIPMESEANIKGMVQGRGFEQITAKVAGDLPCLTIRERGHQIFLNCGSVDLDFTKNGADFALKINELAINEPTFALKGEISRTIPASPTPKNDPPPIWHIDLAGNELNLDQVRDAALSLWGHLPVTNVVCDIVRGGSANTVHYRFDGPADEFKKLDALDLEVDVEAADIYLKHLDLALAKTHGAIEIKRGYLSGRNLSTRINESKAGNGSLRLDLTKRDQIFKLEMDLDVDLIDLVEVLPKVVTSKSLLTELNLFHIFDGRAQGHLKLGDNWQALQVDLQVRQMAGSLFYDRLDDYVEVNGGSLIVRPHEVSWDKVAGKIGPHQLTNSKGSVSWRKKDFTLSITALDGTVQAASLRDRLCEIPALEPLLPQVVTSCSGQVQLRNTSLQGPALQPLEWRYSVELNGSEFSFESPLLPGPVAGSKLSAQLGDSMMEIKTLALKLLDSDVKLSGSLTHSQFQHWQGSLTIDGTARPQLAGWIKEKDWFPAELAPRPPYQASSLQVEWSEEQRQVRGTILAGAPPTVSGKTRPARLDLDIRIAPQRLQLNEIRFSNGTETASLHYDSLTPAHSSFSFAWKGSLSAPTARALFEDQGMLSGAISGDFSITMQPEDAASSSNGQLQVDGCRLPRLLVDIDGPVTIMDLDLQAMDNVLQVLEGHVAFRGQEEINAQGEIKLAEEKLLLDLDLTAQRLSAATVTHFIPDRDQKAGEPLPATPSAYPPWGGTLRFTVDQFMYETTAAGEDHKGSPPLLFEPFSGQILLSPGHDAVVVINRAKSCCLQLTGEYFTAENDGRSHFSIMPACAPDPLLFQEALPCFGIKQDLIEGAFTLNANLNGKPGNWRNGALTLRSDGGRIHRFKLLAKILKVVNLTDLFNMDEQANGESSGKGFAYNKMELETEVKGNNLVIRKAIILGEGINIVARGKLDLTTMHLDTTVLIAPLKTVDAILSRLPLLGRILAGDDETVIGIPVKVEGPLANPKITVLPSSAIGGGILDLITGTLKLPITILSPILPEKSKEPPPPASESTP